MYYLWNILIFSLLSLIKRRIKLLQKQHLFGKSFVFGIREYKFGLRIPDL